MMGYSQGPVRRGQYRVTPMLSAEDVIIAIRQGGRHPPDYIKAVLRNYVEIKFARGKTHFGIDQKLMALERELPECADEFRAIRLEKGLPASRLPSMTRTHDTLRRVQTSTATASSANNRPSPNALYRANTSTSPSVSRASSNASTAATGSRVTSNPRPTRAAFTTNRPIPEDGDEMPPPPYTSVDPEPDSTRLLQERLAAEAQSGVPSRPPPNASPEPEEPVLVHATPVSPRRQSTQQTTSYAPPNSAPPGASMPRPHTPPERQASTPQRVPSDPELRRIWEESQFDEAKRMSTVAERERLELEEALRLSLADSGPSGGGENAMAGPSEYGGLGGQAFGDDSPGSRRASSYTPNADAMGERRRNASDVSGIGAVTGGGGNGGMSDMEALDRGMQGLGMPGRWDQQGQETQGSQPSYGPAQHSQHPQQQHWQQPQHQQYLQPDHTAEQSHHSYEYEQHVQDQRSQSQSHIMPQPTGPSLLDDDDDAPANLPTGPMLTPNKTGAVMQSRNPFLSPTEAEQEQVEHNATAEMPTPSSAGPSTPQPGIYAQGQSPRDYPSPGLSPPSRQSMRDSPGTSRTSFTIGNSHESPRSSKPLPTPPGPGGIQSGSPSMSHFVPPSGPPPAHLRISSPPSGSPQLQQQQQYTPPNASHTQQYQSTGQPPATPPTPNSNQARYVSGSQPPLPPRRDTTQSNLAPQYATPSGPPAIPLRPLQESGEDPLEMLRAYDTVFLVDDSASMATEGRWDQARDSIVGVCEIAAGYDEDGIDVYFCNSKRVGKELKTRVDVDDLFAGLTPRGATPIGSRMESILRDYMSRLERTKIGPSAMADQAEPTTPGASVKPMNLIIVTDGAPSDDPASVIIACAKRLDRGDYPLSQIGIQFFQIGNDPEAREAFQELDDGLSESHGVRDMVDTVPFTGEMNAGFIIKTLLGGVNRRLDRRD